MILSRKVQVTMIMALLGFPILTFLNLPRVDEKGRLWREPLRSSLMGEEGVVPGSTSVVVSGLVVPEEEEAVSSSTTVVVPEEEVVVPGSTSVVVSGLVVPEVEEAVSSSTTVVVSEEEEAIPSSTTVVVPEVEEAVSSSTTVVVPEVEEAVPSSTTVVEEDPDEIKTEFESRSPSSEEEEVLLEDEVTKPHIWDEVYLPSWPPIYMWDELAACESGQNWEIDTGNGYFGGLQFSLSTWRWVGGLANPSASSRMEQIYRANLLWETQGWQPWPGCRSKFGWSRWQVIS